MYAIYGANTAVTSLSGTTNAWGDTKYLATAQWGTAGNAVTGKGATNSSGQGTSLTLANNGLTFTPAAASSTTYTAQAYTMLWLQPKYASTYAAGTLRRYSGGSSNGDKVKGYCFSTRLVSVTSNVSKGIVANTAVTTLTGAAALFAGVSAVLGTAAVIF